jgi:hypothetical protein
MNNKLVGTIVFMLVISTTIQAVGLNNQSSNDITKSNEIIKNNILASSSNGKILDQQLNENGQGYTVMQLWGSYYEMGYAHAELLGDYIVQGINQVKDALGGAYSNLKSDISESTWMPSNTEDELDGMVDSIAISHPDEGIDKNDIKVYITIGDWGYNYACRSHSCWGRYVEDPVKTLSTRRLDYHTAIPIGNHHLLCVYIPNDGSVKWVNFAFPGFITAFTAVNEYGTLGSIHDWIPMGSADLSSGRMSRTAACRLALVNPTNPDISTHISDIFTELQDYEIMTKAFINYYVPEGYGGVLDCDIWRSGPDIFQLRLPHEDWHHGEAIITTNTWTDGSFTPPDENFGADVYYDDESPKTHESHWDLIDVTGGNLNLHIFSVEYRDSEDMTIWAEGRIDGVGRTPRLEYEWTELTKSVPRPVTISVEKINNHPILTRLFELFPNVLPFLRILMDFN